ncbi:hypothetical protein [Pontibacter sp. G13]|uniref:hypothetical protein n=1 Tax=Pontibacter sp. G13 TaxID=3074898 RepID=UPI00288AD84A|nr:hypothetical protein [Pontibacter sp. G13]WNJ18918.1 hypothetical protein RJD25_00385 [Pontibacter sp. G13]
MKRKHLVHALCLTGMVAFGAVHASAQSKQAPVSHQQEAQVAAFNAAGNNPILKVVQDQVAQMEANQQNPAYDMEGALKVLKKYTMYPFNHFEPNFPIVLRSVDAAKDEAELQKAMEIWQSKQ